MTSPVPTKYSYKVNDHLYASEYPINCADTKFSEKLNAMILFGITDFIDLTQTGELHPYKQFLPEGIQHWSFPIRDNHAPQNKQQMDDIVSKISSLIEAGRVVDVHCWGGIGRTGMVINAWLGKTLHLSADKAMELQQSLWKANPKSQFTPYKIEDCQKAFLRQYLDGEK